MILFPAIDLVAGQVVRLSQGDRSRMDVYSRDPASVARDYVRRGASWIHVVDLSAAFEEDEPAREANDRAIEAICSVGGVGIDVGGGVRTLERIERLASLGASRIALGTVLVRDPAFSRAAAERFGSLLVADVAARGGEVRVNGWREGTHLLLDDLLGRLAADGFSHLVLTDVSRDGMGTGVDVTAYQHAAEVAGFPVVASGGIASLDDIRALAKLPEALIEGAIVGRALYEHAFTLEEALEAAEGPEGGASPE